MFYLTSGELKDHLRLFLAELLGTFILVGIGLGAVAQYTLMAPDHRDFISVALAFGFALVIAIVVVGRISGAHLNPAVTLALCVFRKHPWSRLFVYWLGQYLGAFLAALTVYLLHYDGINYERSPTGQQPAGQTLLASYILTTYPPNDQITVATSCFDQVIGTAFLVLSIMAATDPDNLNISPDVLPFHLGATLTVIHLSLAYNGGAPVNPARDLSPRLVAQIFGLEGLSLQQDEGDNKTVYPDATPFSMYRFYFWIPWLMPHLGAIVGALVYKLFVELPRGTVEDDENDDENPPSPTSVRTLD